jgi:ribosome-associated protein
MDIRKLQRAIVDGLEDVKAQNIAVFNTEHLTPMFERVIVASGTSNRQTKALASSVRETVKSRGLPILSVEGADNGEWIIVDCGAAVAHIMQPAIRDYYRLEEIWGEKPVKMKLDGESRAAVAPLPVKKAAAPRKAAPADETPAKKATGGKTAARKTGAVRGAGSAKPPARKSAAHSR